MSTYSKGPAMGNINSAPGNTETNQDIINNVVNGTSVNNRRTSSRSLCPESLTFILENVLTHILEL